jgi:two-component system, cell cycle sensor histidine kinase and response regulator CckA
VTDNSSSSPSVQPSRSGGIWAAILAAGAAGLGGAAAGAAFGAGAVVWSGLALAAAAHLLAVRQWRRDNPDRLLRRVLEALPTGQRLVGPDGRTVLINEAFYRLSGGGAGEEPLAALSGVADDGANAAAEFERLRADAAAGQYGRADLRVTVGGCSEWRRVEVFPIAGGSGAAHWRIEDITPRREMERVMIQEQAKTADFLEHAPIGFYSVDGDGVFLFVNATLADWLGIPAEDLVRSERRLHEFLLAPPRGLPHDITDAGGAEQRARVVMIGAEGRRFHAEIAQSVTETGEGIVYTRSVVRDLTPERTWAEALRRSEQRFQRFFEDAPVGVVLTDNEGRLIECNRAFLDLSGADAGEAQNRPFTDCVAEDFRNAITERLAAVRRGEDEGEPLVVRFARRREREAQVYVRRQRGGGLSLHFLDLTDRRHLEAQFAQSQKMQAVGQLAGGVAHDFNNLLTAMIGFCDLLLLRHKPGDQSFSDIMQIKQNANRAANLVRQLLAFSRQQTLQARVLNVTDVLAELSNLLRRLIGENIELRMLHGRDLGLIKVDQNQLEQVIINLCVNARDAMAGGGRLTVVTSNRIVTQPEHHGHDEVAPGDYVSIEVVDTGHGIPVEHLPRIFEPFFSTKAIGSGTGLGLSTVYGIVRQTGGYVLVDSNPGEGARFTILLPRHQGEGRAAEAGEVRERVGSDLTGTATILLVEDEDAVRVFSSRALRNKGYQVLEAKNGEAALSLLMQERDSIDLMITDVVMPVMDGPTLARKVREARPDMRVIFISGYAEDRFKDELGDMHFLPKPFSLKQLAAKVKDVIREG